MNKRVFFLLGFIFLILGLMSFLLFVILFPSNLYTFSAHKIALHRLPACGEGCGSAPGNIGDTSYYFLTVQDERPVYMALNSSATVSVALATNIAGPPFTPTPVAGNYQIDQYSSSYQGGGCGLCTPDTQFGSGYTVFAFAQLSGTTFAMQLVGDADQTVKTPIVYWDWNIKATEAGSQVVNFVVELLWKRAGTIVQAEKIVRSSFSITVTQPLLTLSPLSVGALTSGIINAVLGTGLTIPFVLERLEKRNQKKKSNSSLKEKAVPPRKETTEPVPSHFCTQCGQPIRGGSRYCANCGFQVA